MIIRSFSDALKIAHGIKPDGYEALTLDDLLDSLIKKGYER